MINKNKVSINGLVKMCLISSWKEYLFVIVLTLIQCMEFRNRFGAYKDVPAAVTMGDFLFDFFKGIEPYMETFENETFRIPGIWSFYFLFFLCIQALAFARCCQRSQQFLLRYVSRREWWKLLNRILVLNVILLYVFTYAVIFLFCIFTKVKFGWPSGEVQSFFNHLDIQGMKHYELLFCGVIIPIVATILLTYIQYVFTLLWGNLIGVIGGVILLVSSSYFCCHGLLGNYMMIIRNQRLLGDGRGILISLLICAGGTVLCAGIGRKRIETFDFYS